MGWEERGGKRRGRVRRGEKGKGEAGRPWDDDHEAPPGSQTSASKPE